VGWVGGWAGGVGRHWSRVGRVEETRQTKEGPPDRSTRGDAPPRPASFMIVVGSSTAVALPRHEFTQKATVLRMHARARAGTRFHVVRQIGVLRVRHQALYIPNRPPPIRAPHLAHSTPLIRKLMRPRTVGSTRGHTELSLTALPTLPLWPAFGRPALSTGSLTPPAAAGKVAAVAVRAEFAAPRPPCQICQVHRRPACLPVGRQAAQPWRRMHRGRRSWPPRPRGGAGRCQHRHQIRSRRRQQSLCRACCLTPRRPRHGPRPCHRLGPVRKGWRRKRVAGGGGAPSGCDVVRGRPFHPLGYRFRPPRGRQRRPGQWRGAKAERRRGGECGRSGRIRCPGPAGRTLPRSLAPSAPPRPLSPLPGILRGR
jgi:hypothetical protein